MQLVPGFAQLGKLLLLEPRVGGLAFQRDVAPLLVVLQFIPEFVQRGLGHEVFSRQFLLAFDAAVQPDDLVIDLDEVPPMGEPVLFELQLDGPHVVELLGHRCFTAQHLELQVRIRKHGDRVARIDERAVLDEHLLHPPALDGVEVDGAARHEAPAQWNEVFERAGRHSRNENPVGVDAEAAAAHQQAGYPPHERNRHQRGRAVSGEPGARRLALHDTVHALARNAHLPGFALFGDATDFFHVLTRSGCPYPVHSKSRAKIVSS